MNLMPLIEYSFWLLSSELLKLQHSKWLCHRFTMNLGERMKMCPSWQFAILDVL